jgi:hypothetical protein
VRNQPLAGHARPGEAGHVVVANCGSFPGAVHSAVSSMRNAQGHCAGGPASGRLARGRHRAPRLAGALCWRLYGPSLDASNLRRCPRHPRPAGRLGHDHLIAVQAAQAAARCKNGRFKPARRSDGQQKAVAAAEARRQRAIAGIHPGWQYSVEVPFKYECAVEPSMAYAASSAYFWPLRARSSWALELRIGGACRVELDALQAATLLPSSV